MQSAYSTRNEYPSVYSPDITPVTETLSNKQMMYDSRMNQLNQKIDNITLILDKIKSRNKGFTKLQLDYLNHFLKEWERVSKWDFSVGQNFNNVLNWLRKVENTVFDWL
jgi:hypothetical protein